MASRPSRSIEIPPPDRRRRYVVETASSKDFSVSCDARGPATRRRQAAILKSIGFSLTIRISSTKADVAKAVRVLAKDEPGL
jgi:hypothetical protein